MPGDRLTFVGHATILVEIDGLRVLTDPLLGPGIGPIRRRGAPPSAELSRDLDAVLVSHLHHDHVHLRSLRSIGADVPLVVPAGSGAFFRRRGFQVTELVAGQSAAVGGVGVTAVDALHDGARPFAGFSADALGYVLSGARSSVYFAGDTDIFDGMAELAGEIDVALLPIAGWGPTLGEGHLNPESAARAAAMLRPRIVVPIHWGTFYPLGLARLRPGPLLKPPGRFAAAMKRLAPEVEVEVLYPGESLSLA